MTKRQRAEVLVALLYLKHKTSQEERRQLALDAGVHDPRVERLSDTEIADLVVKLYDTL